MKRERAAREWSKARLILELRRTCSRPLPADATLSRMIARWENTGARPDEHYAQLLCQVYGRTAAELGIAPPAAPSIPEQPSGTGYPASPQEAVNILGELWRADLDQAPHVLTAQPETSAWSAAPLQWLVSPDSAPIPEHAHGLRVGLADVHRVKQTSDSFAAMDDAYGGGHARPMLMQYLNTEVAGLLNGRYSEAVGRALFASVAEATLLAGWMSYDTGHHGIAQRYFVQALRLAHDGQDQRLASSILSAMSHQARYLGEARSAVTLAHGALAGITRVGTPTMRAQFHAMAARGLAAAGDTAAAERELAASAAELERQRLEDEPEWITYFDPAEHAAEASHSFRDLHKAKLAVREAATATSGHVRSDFFSTMVLADAHLAAGDLEEACRVAAEALDFGEQLKSARVVKYLQDFRANLTGHAGHPAVRDLTDQSADNRLWLASSAKTTD